MTLRKNLSGTFSAYLLGVPLVFIFSMLEYVWIGNMKSLMGAFLFVYILTVLYTIRYFGMISLYALYLYTSGFFIYDCFVFSLFGDKNFLLQHWPVHFYISETSGVIFIMICFLTVYVSHVVYCLLPKQKYKLKAIGTEKKHNVGLEKVGVLLMLMALFPVMYKIYVQLDFVRTHGYEAVFDGSMSEINYPFWCAGSFIIFIGGYAVFFSSRPPQKKFIIFSLLFLLLYGFDSLKGQRGPIISAILVFVFMLGKQYDVKIKLKHMIILLITVITMVIALNNIRSGYGDSEKKKTIVTEKLVAEIIYGQTTSRQVPLLVIDRKLKYHPYPFIFSPLFTPYYSVVYPSKGQDRISAEHHNNISQVTMYNLSPQVHLAGGGLGGAFLAEAYDCGGFIGVLIWSIILAFILVQYDFALPSISLKYRPFLFFYLLTVPTLPRGRMLGFLLDLNKIIFVYVLLLIVSMRQYLQYKNKNE